MDQVNLAILSFAHGHAYHYADTILKLPDASLVSCWDDDVARGEEAARKYGIRYERELERILGDPLVDAVIVTSETNRHAKLVCRAASAKKAILCQKPLALSVADCDAVTKAVEEEGIFFSMAFQMRHDPLNIKIRELVHSGAIGKVGYIRRRHTIGVLWNDDFVKGKTAWHLDPEKNMGMFMDDAVHVADFFRWILGEPVSVIAEVDAVLTDLAPDDIGEAVYRFESGTVASLYNSSIAWSGENTVEVDGEKGIIIQSYGDGPSLTLPRPTEAVPLKWFSLDEGWQQLAMPIPGSQAERIRAVPPAFIEALRQGAAPPATAYDGKRAVEMILGAYRSSKEGRRISLRAAGSVEKPELRR